MLRWFALLLLLANAGYFAWSQGHLADLGYGPATQREPQRLTQQVAPEQLRVIAPEPSAQTFAQRSAQSSAQASTQTPAQSTDQSTDTPSASAASDTAAAEPTTCQQVAGLSSEQADALQARLSQAGWPAGRWQREASVLPERWIVYIGKFPSADLMNRKKTELRSLKVDFREVNAPALQPGLALGTYSTEASAQTALSDLGRAGVRSARVTKEREAQRTELLRLPALTAAERERANEAAEAVVGRGLSACPA